MICFPNAKINIGLNVLSKRKDSFHNIESLFYPIPLYDCIEIREAKHTKIINYGLKVVGNTEDNLCYKAFQLFQRHYDIPNIEIHLLKNIPMGAGLGGGSADAAFLLGLLNDSFACKASSKVLKELALQLGSDCSFFLSNKPAFVSGRGEILSEVNLDLSGYYLLLINPDIHISTVDAYKNIVPRKPENDLLTNIQTAISNWEKTIKNDFELFALAKYPLLKKIKKELYDLGAVYASMTGTGSTFYGIFKEKPDFSKQDWKPYFVRCFLVGD